MGLGGVGWGGVGWDGVGWGGAPANALKLYLHGFHLNLERWAY